MTQIKLFKMKTPYMEQFESQVNQFLSDNAETIKVKNITYTATQPNPNNETWVFWTAMVEYESL